MEINKQRIEETLHKHNTNKIEVSIRSRVCHSTKFSKFIPYNENAKKLIYNSHLIDGVKFKLEYIKLTFNARHKNKD